MVASMKTHPASLDEATLMAECRAIRQRRSGPGGQNRNKVETAVMLTHVPTGIKGQASERRSQELNRQEAIFRLRVNLAIEVRTSIDNAVALSDAWLNRLNDGKIAISAQHDDFPQLLAEALNVLAHVGWETKTATARLGLTVSQLVKFLSLEPRALILLNTARQTQGLRPLM